MRTWIAKRPSLIAALFGPLLAMLLWSGLATAQTPSNSATLDALFAQLRMAPDAETANAIDERIWFYWSTPDDPALAGQMQEVFYRRDSGDLVGALALLDDIVIEHPDYAEAWNQRATIHFMQGDQDASLADIEKVLQFEPRHFGALAGRAMIYRGQGKQALALKDMATALAVHPFLAERALFPELLQDVTRI